MALRITKNDKAEISRLNRNIREKKNRAAKNYGMEVNFDRVGISDFTTRAELNAYKQKAAEFLRVGAHATVTNEKGVELALRDVVKYKQTIRRANRTKQKRLEEINKLNSTRQGQETGKSVEQTQGLMGDVRLQEFNPLSDSVDWVQSPAKFKEALKKKVTGFKGDFLKRSDVRLMENYLSKLTDVFGDDAEPIIAAIRQKGVTEFMAGYYRDIDGGIHYLYTKEQYEKKLSVLKSIHRVK